MKKLPPFRLKLEPLSDEAKKLPKFKWAKPDIGSRHKIGGEPDFIQKSEWPNCPDCAQKMSFYGQLDSLNDEFIIADCGMIFVFVCFSCNTVKAQVQSN